MKKKLIFTCTTLIAATSFSGAAPIYEEGFNVADGTAINASGTGFTGSALTIEDYTWGSWSNYSVIANKSVENTTATSSRNSRNTSAVGSATGFSSTINADTSGTIFYSFTMNGSATASNGWFNFMISAGDPSSYSSTNGADIFTQWDGGNKGFDNSSDPTTSGDLLIAGGQDLLVVGRVDFETATNQDTYYLSVFTTGQDASVVGSSFQISSNARNTTGLLDRIAISLDDGTSVGNFRVGTSLADVGIVPEPSSYALLGGLLALGWVGIRRRS